MLKPTRSWSPFDRRTPHIPQVVNGLRNVVPFGTIGAHPSLQARGVALPAWNRDINRARTLDAPPFKAETHC